MKAALPARTAAVASLTAGASNWIEGLYGAKATVGRTSEPVVLPIIRSGQPVEYRIVTPVDVSV